MTGRNVLGLFTYDWKKNVRPIYLRLEQKPLGCSLMAGIQALGLFTDE